MDVLFTNSSALEETTALIEQAKKNSTTQSLLLFVGDENGWDTDQLDQLVKNQDIALIGGVFPQIIYQANRYQTGCVVVGIADPLSPIVIEGLSDPSADFETAIDETVPEDLSFESIFVAVDGLSNQIRSFVDGLFAVLGSELNYVGGGAGSLSFVQKPCVFTNEGVFQDAAVMAMFPKKLPVKVGHGWVPFDKDHQVTSVDKNIVKEIDYKNALEVYEGVIGNQLKTPITAENFFESAQSFPLGIKRMEGEHIVRDPIAINDEGHLICVGELSEGDYIDILTAQKNQLIEAAGLTAQGAKELQDALNKEETGVLFIDCISRVLFLDDEFTKELEQVKNKFDPDAPLFGALVLGEIANSGTGYLEFYNKTSVVAVL